MHNNWYAITGGPSSGKTSLINELKKMGHNTVPESARLYIDTEISKGNTIDKIREDEKRFQEEVIKLKEKLESQYDKDKLIFFDRGMHDSLAYMRSYGYKVEDWFESIIEAATYAKVFLLEPLAKYEEDYARTESKEFSRSIHGLLHEAYSEFGMKPISVPPVNVKERVKFIMSEVEKG